MSYSPWQHLGSVTFAASTLSSFPFSSPSPTLRLLLFLPESCPHSCPRDLAFAGDGFDTKVSSVSPLADLNLWDSQF